MVSDDTSKSVVQHTHTHTHTHTRMHTHAHTHDQVGCLAQQPLQLDWMQVFTLVDILRPI